MTAPGTIPIATKATSSARRPARRARIPASTRAAMMTATSAIVPQRTTRSPKSWTDGSNWNVTTAIGTVDGVYRTWPVRPRRRTASQRSPKTCRLADTRDVSLCLAGTGDQDHHRRQYGWRGVSPVRRDRRRWGPPVETRASGPWGYGPDVAFTGSEAAMPTITSAERVRLKVDLLGRLDARRTDGGQIRLPGRHSQALFALLVLARRPRSREAIAADLWPEADGTSAGSLRQALWLVRQSLAEAGFAAGGRARHRTPPRGGQ